MENIEGDNAEVMNPGHETYETWACPSCNGHTTFIHDLKCTVCNNIDVVWCPKCKRHFNIY